MKIALVSHNFIKNDGQGRVCLEIAKYISRKHEVHIYANKIDKEIIKNKNIFLHKVPTIFSRPIFIKSLFFLIFSSLYLLFKKFDLIHLHGAVSLVPCDINTVHLCHTACEKEVPYNIKTLRGLYFKIYRKINSLLEMYSFKRSKILIAVSQKVKKELVKYLHIPENRVRVILNGIEKEEFKEKEEKDREELIKHYKIDKKNLILIYMGDTTQPEKNFKVLIEVMKKLEGKPVSLFVLGKVKKSNYPKLVEKLKIKNIYFLGFQKDVSLYLRGSDIFLFPSLYDSFGLSVLEAMASGTPPLLSDKNYCGVAEIIKNGENGIIIKDPRNVNEIIDIIEKLFEKREIINEMGKRARETALKYTFEKMVKNYERVYNEKFSS